MKLAFWALICIAFYPLYALGSGNISGTYAYNAIDSLKGLSVDYEKDFLDYEVETDGSIQQGGIIEGDAHIAVAFAVGSIQLKPFGELKFVKTEDWGHTLDGGIKINIPIVSIDVAVGVFGRSSNAFIPLQKGTRNPVTGAVKWDDATLLDFNDLGVLNALFETQFELNLFHVGITGIFDISNRKFHQVITEIMASWELERSIWFSITAEHIAQVGEGGGQQIDFIAAVGYKF